MPYQFSIDSAPIKNAKLLTHDFSPFNQGYYPYEYTNPKDELLACREGAWIGCFLNMMPAIDVWGPDAVKMLNDMCVNRDFGLLKIGASRHALTCDEEGYIRQSGIVMRKGEDHFRTYCLMPPIFAFLFSGQYQVEWKQLDEFFYQVDGPKSLPILEEALQADLHDLKFAQNKTVEVEGFEIFVHRIGMSGALAYELHGCPESADLVYDRILAAGEDKGLKQLGTRQYCSNHTPGGYPNGLIHFWNSPTPLPGMPDLPPILTGSCADDEKNYYANPWDVGWGNLVKFDEPDRHYIGREALEKIAAGPKRTCVTLEWNVEDVAAVVAAEISDPEMDLQERILGFNEQLPEFTRQHADYVLKGDEQVGVASGRVIDYFAHTFVSLAFVNEADAVMSDEVEVLWGKPGTRQMRIRAKICPVPYWNGEYRNETCDVNALYPERPYLA